MAELFFYFNENNFLENHQNYKLYKASKSDLDFDDKRCINTGKTIDVLEHGKVYVCDETNNNLKKTYKISYNLYNSNYASSNIMTNSILQNIRLFVVNIDYYLNKNGEGKNQKFIKSLRKNLKNYKLNPDKIDDNNIGKDETYNEILKELKNSNNLEQLFIDLVIDRNNLDTHKEIIQILKNKNYLIPK